MSRLAEATAALDAHRAGRAEAPPSLFDAPPIVAALASVEVNASEQWNFHALEAVRSAARVHAELTVDEVHRYITEPVHDARALGAVMLRAARLGIIERQAGQFRISERSETHSRPLAVWRSAIYIGRPDA